MHKIFEKQLTSEILQQKIEQEVCLEIPNAFWRKKKHIVRLPYIKGFNERNIPTKARPIQTNQE